VVGGVLLFSAARLVFARTPTEQAPQPPRLGISLVAGAALGFLGQDRVNVTELNADLADADAVAPRQ